MCTSHRCLHLLPPLYIPLSETVYEVISCPYWEFRINLHVSISLINGLNSEETVNLTPGLTSKWKDLSFTPLTVSQAPTPVLTTYFLTNGEKVALFESNKIPDLHCSDENSAALLNCSLSPACCTDCRPNQDTLVSCKCRNLVLENLLENPQQLLPLTSGKISLRNIKKDIFSESNYAPIQLLVTMENFHLIAEVDQTSCNILPKKLVGCYKCNTGGEFSYQCYTNFGTAIAEIKCENGITFVSHCNPTLQDYETILPFNHSIIHSNCSVHCPGGSTTFTIQGQLEYISIEQQSYYQNSSVDTTSQFDESIPFPKFELGALFEYFTIFPNFLLPILFLPSTLFLLFLVAKFHPVFHFWKFFNRYTALTPSITIATIIFAEAAGSHDVSQKESHVSEKFKPSKYVYIKLTNLPDNSTINFLSHQVNSNSYLVDYSQLQLKVNINSTFNNKVN